MKDSVGLRLSRSTIGRSSKILNKTDLKKIYVVAIVQILLSFMDLLGVAIVGVLGALAISGVESQKPGNRVSSVLKFLNLQNMNFQSVILVLGTGAATILLARTVASIIITKRTLHFLSNRGALISSRIISQILSMPLLRLQKYSSQSIIYSVTQGVEALALGIIGTSVTLISDLSLLLVMFVGLFVVDPTTALTSILVFTLIGILLYLFMHKKSQILGASKAKLNVESNELIVEVLEAYREISVRNRKSYYANKINNIRFDMASTSAEISFLPNISKYVMEASIVFGALVIAAVQFLMKDAVHAVATLSIFMAAGTRIGPAALRVQQGAVQIRTGGGYVEPTLQLIEDLRGYSPISDKDLPPEFVHRNFVPKIELNSVFFTYPDQINPAISDVNLSIEPGSVVAIVGPSGAGKTTLVDILLGVISPDKGSVQISSSSPEIAIEKWPGAIAYVPQDVVIMSGSIKKNVAQGFSTNQVPDQDVSAALRTAKLDDFISGLPLGIEAEVGERGTNLSGGQRQRLGIARALLTKPALLVLDEATSALDGDTELQISQAIKELRGNTTVILIAHRLSTVRDADKVVYMAKGQVVSTGTFEEVRKSIPDFDRQASLMGL
jgi:ABC-type multidrug transport system fused ATPase/permease subunit